MLYWLRSRFTRCYAQGCGRRLLFHSPWRAYRCHRSPLGISLSEEPRGEREAG
jgi:hypothetical protein